MSATFVADRTEAVLRFGAQNPGHPWWSVADRVIEALVGFSQPLLPSVRFGLYTPSALQGARYNPIEVGEERLDVAITTPAAAAWMALHGVGIYDRAYPSLRAIANYPHDDFVLFLVDAATGVETLRELVDRRLALRVVTGRKVGEEQDILTFVVDEVLKRHGASYAAIEEWGGTVIYGGPTHIGGRLMLEGAADALFQEAQMGEVWQQIADRRDVRCLALDEDAIADMTATLGIRRAEVPAGHHRGVDAAVPTVDFSGWLVLCREDLPPAYAQAIAAACERVIPELDQFDEVRRCLTRPIDPASLFGYTGIPLHPGAEAHARERGYLG